MNSLQVITYTQNIDDELSETIVEASLIEDPAPVLYAWEDNTILVEDPDTVLLLARLSYENALIEAETVQAHLPSGKFVLTEGYNQNTIELVYNS